MYYQKMRAGLKVDFDKIVSLWTTYPALVPNVLSLGAREHETDVFIVFH